MSEAHENFNVRIRGYSFDDFVVSKNYLAHVSGFPSNITGIFNLKIIVFNVGENLNSPIKLWSLEYELDDILALTREYEAGLINVFISGDTIIFNIRNYIYIFDISTGNLDELFSVNVADDDYINIVGFIDNMVYVNFNGDFVEYDMSGNQVSIYNVGDILPDDESTLFGHLLKSPMGIVYCIKSEEYTQSEEYLQLRLLRTNETILNITTPPRMNYIDFINNIIIYSTLRGEINYFNLNDNTSHEIYLVDKDNKIFEVGDKSVTYFRASPCSTGISIWMHDVGIYISEIYRQYILPMRQYSGMKSARSHFANN